MILLTVEQSLFFDTDGRDRSFTVIGYNFFYFFDSHKNGGLSFFIQFQCLKFPLEISFLWTTFFNVRFEVLASSDIKNCHVLGCDTRYCDRTVPTFGGTCWLHLRGRRMCSVFLYFFLSFSFLNTSLLHLKVFVSLLYFSSPQPLHHNSYPCCACTNTPSALFRTSILYWLTH